MKGLLRPSDSPRIMWAFDQTCTACACTSRRSSPLRWCDPWSWSCRFRTPRAAQLLPHTLRFSGHSKRRVNRGNGRDELCNGAARDGPLAASVPCFQHLHPAESLSRPTEAPVDLNAASFRLAMDELERLYDIPLVAPRAFQVVAQQRCSAAAAALGALLEASATAATAAEAVATEVALATGGSIPISARSLFLPWELAGSRGAPSAAATATAFAASSVFSQQLPAPQLGPQAPTQPLPRGPMPADKDKDTDTGSADGQTLGSLGSLAALERGAGPLPRIDPRDFPSLTPHHLATLLLECAARKVPLRLSVLQSYADQVSYRAPQLTADELVSALDGLSRYSAQWRNTAAQAPVGTSAAAARRGLGSSSSSSSSSGGRPALPRLSASAFTWADRILMCLLTAGPGSNPLDSAATRVSVSQTAALSPQASTRGATAAGAAHGAERRKRSSGDTGPGGGLLRPRVASLEPHRAVELARLLVQLNVRPPPGWTEGFLRGTCHLVPRMSGANLTRLLELLPALAAAPEAAWWNAVLDTWAPTGPPPPAPARGPMPSPAAAVCGSGGGNGDGGSAGVSDPLAGDGSSCATAAPEAANPGFPAGHRSRHGSSDEGAGAAANGVGRSGGDSGLVHSSGSVDGGGDGDGGGGAASGLSATEVRSAVLYGILTVGLPQGPGAAVLARRLGGWTKAALYDMAREVLASGQLARGAAALGGGGGGLSIAGAVRGFAPSSSNPDPVAAAATIVSGAADFTQAAPPPPSGRSIARALAALPVVMPGASDWASDPAGCGGGVLAVLVTSLEPRLKEQPAGLLVELIRGFSSSRLHPGPRFLLLHAMVLKGRTEELQPRQLLQAARYYTKLGLSPRGGLRAAVLRAREVLRREALKARSA
ncbi:hypothetical protein PLESTF_001607200 [Pleodorina starrii]|nr:hypothetical protein PLESTF_001607200 [Pleodorina starrii]